MSLSAVAPVNVVFTEKAAPRAVASMTSSIGFQSGV